MASIRQRLDDLEEMNALLKKQKKGGPSRSFVDKLTGKNKPKKDYRLPRKLRAGVTRKIKQNYAIVLKLRSNQAAGMEWAPIVNDMVYNKDTDIYHIATANYTFHLDGKFPLLVIPEWDVEPLRPDKHIEETIKKGNYSLPQKVTINAMKLAQMGPKKGFGGKTWLWILLGAGIVLYFLSELLKGGT